MSKVFILDTNKQPLDPVHPGWARKLLSTGRAAVWRRYPFTIILKKAVDEPVTSPLRLKLDPGSQTTGMAIVNDASGEVVFAAELTHRGQQIKAALDSRRAVRRSRRQRKTRYRKPRFANRNKPKGWLPPSLLSRVLNVETWVRRLMRVCPIGALSQELVRFDMQQMENAEIRGVEYQHGSLAGYETRAYLLEKWGRRCAYCDATGVPLEVEHIVCRKKHGSNRVSNLTLACTACNRAKGTQDIRAFLKHDPARCARLLAYAKASLRDAAAVNATRWALFERLIALGVPVECGTGGCTSYNRSTRGIEKHHWTDAVCVGASTPEHVQIITVVPLLITAKGHGCRQLCSMNRYGFPRTGPKQARRVQGMQTGDIVRAVVPSGKKRGTHVGRVLVRATGFFDIAMKQGRVAGINAKYCRSVHRQDGYSYAPGGK